MFAPFSAQPESQAPVQQSQYWNWVVPGISFWQMSHGILIVDDSSQIRNMVRLWLETDDKFEVCGEAADGVEGIEKALELKPDLIVLDLLMPRMNGLQAAKALHSTMPEIPIILFTLFPDSELANQARQAGISTVLSKMDQMSLLCDEVQKLVGRP